MLPPVSIKRRVLALVYESLFVVAIAILAGLVAGGLNTLISLKIPALLGLTPIFTLFILLVSWWYYFKLNWIREGQTLPMRVWRIALHSQQGKRPSIMQLRLRFFWAIIFLVFIPLLVYACVRHSLPDLPVGLVSLLAIVWWILPFGFAFFHPRSQFLYDYLAGTELVDLKD